MKTNTYIVWALLLIGMLGCNEDEIDTYDNEQAAVNFLSYSTDFSFLNSEDQEKGVIELPVQMMGSTVDYDRKIAVELIDSLTTATVADFSILEAVVPANELNGLIRIEVKNSEMLLDTVMSIGVKCIENEHFTLGFINAQQISGTKYGYLYPYHVLRFTNQLVKPANWRSWHFWFCTTYSRDLHLLILEVLGDAAANFEYYGEFTGKRSTADEGYALNRKLRRYVSDYNANNPNNKLKHSEDGLYYSAYNTATPTAAGGKEITLRVR